MKQIGTKYNEAVQLIKSAILHNQLEAAKAVNRQNNLLINMGRGLVQDTYAHSGSSTL